MYCPAERAVNVSKTEHSSKLGERRKTEGKVRRVGEDGKKEYGKKKKRSRLEGRIRLSWLTLVKLRHQSSLKALVTWHTAHQGTGIASDASSPTPLALGCGLPSAQTVSDLVSIL